MFPIRKHFGDDYYTYTEMQAMIDAANARPVTLNGRPARVSWNGPKASAFDGLATRQAVAWPRLAYALNGNGAL
jgi:hypothetical protein